MTVLDINVALFETFQSVEGLFIDFLIYGVPEERMSMSKVFRFLQFPTIIDSLRVILYSIVFFCVLLYLLLCIEED